MVFACSSLPFWTDKRKILVRSNNTKKKTNETFTNMFNMFIFGKQCCSRLQFLSFFKYILSMFGKKWIILRVPLMGRNVYISGSSDFSSVVFIECDSDFLCNSFVVHCLSICFYFCRPFYVRPTLFNGFICICKLLLLLFSLIMYVITLSCY